VALLSSWLKEGGGSDQPAIHAVMAFTTVHRKALRPMIGAFRLVVCLEMTAHTFRRQSLPIELADGARLMAFVAIHNRVRADQRKPILVLVDVMHRHCPAIDVMAQVALGTVAAPVNIGVAVLALLAGVGEDRIDVALLARNFCVQSAQRERRLAVIKFRLRTQRQPSVAGMAVLTRNLQRPMGISVGGRHAGLFLASGRVHQQQEAQEPVYIPGFESP
jgi:hypothetical protein